MGTLYHNSLRRKALWPIPTGARIGRVEKWRGGLGRAYLLPTLSVVGASLAMPCSVSTSRSSNRTCGFPASGSRTRFILKAYAVSEAHRDSRDPWPRTNSCVVSALATRTLRCSSTCLAFRYSFRCSAWIARGVSRLMVNRRLPLLLRPHPGTRAPSLHRHYPASLVLRAAPPPVCGQTPEAPGGRADLQPPQTGFPCCPLFLVGMLSRTTPAKRVEPVVQIVRSVPAFT